MIPRMRFGLSSCSPVGLDGGPLCFGCEESVCCAASAARSASVAILGAGAAGLAETISVSVEDVSATTDESEPSVAPKASKSTTMLFGDGACGSSWPCDLAVAGETVAVSALAQVNASTRSLDFRRSINLRGNQK